MAKPYFCRKVEPPFKAISDFLRIPQKRGDPPLTDAEVLRNVRALAARQGHDLLTAAQRPQCFGDFSHCLEVEMDRCTWRDPCETNSPGGYRPKCFRDSGVCPYVKARLCQWKYTCNGPTEHEKRERLHLKHYQHLNIDQTTA